MPSKVVLAYLAGVIDSDGSITIAVDRWRVKALNRAATYSENIALGQTRREAIDLMKETFGGHISGEKARSERRNPMLIWGASDKTAASVAVALLPFLRIKRKQAQLLLSLRRLKDRGRAFNCFLDETPVMRRTRWGERPFRRMMLRPEVQAEYDALVREIRSLNDTRFPWDLSSSDSVIKIGLTLAE